MQQRVYETRVNNVDELKQRLVGQSGMVCIKAIINSAVWRRLCAFSHKGEAF